MIIINIWYLLLSLSLSIRPLPTGIWNDGDLRRDGPWSFVRLFYEPRCDRVYRVVPLRWCAVLLNVAAPFSRAQGDGSGEIEWVRLYAELIFMSLARSLPKPPLLCCLYFRNCLPSAERTAQKGENKGKDWIGFLHNAVIVEKAKPPYTSCAWNRNYGRILTHACLLQILSFERRFHFSPLELKFLLPRQLKHNGLVLLQCLVRKRIKTK